MKNQKQFGATLLAMALVALPPLVAAVCVVVLGGCASPNHPIAPQAHANAAPESSPPPKDEDFPKLSTAKWEQGAFPSLEALRAMRTGMGKDPSAGELPAAQSARGNRSGGLAVAEKNELYE